MKIGSWLTYFVVLCLTLTIFACSPSSPTENPTANAPAVDPTGTTAAPIIQNPTGTASAPADDGQTASDLKEAAALQILGSSFSAYPWRMHESILVKATGQTSTTLTEAQSSTRGYTKSVQTTGAEMVTVESIRMDSILYLKITGSGVAEKYGIVDGQWVEVLPDSPLAQLANAGAAAPARIADSFAAEFAALSGESGMDELVFKFVGSDVANDIPTDIYDAKGETFTYRWWIGADQLLYQMTLDVSAATRMILFEYDPAINIQSPIP